jgi:predicted pyridoxine 5'-phosphate oxidase superfamily flavin-nucleotide-binding protein
MARIPKHVQEFFPGRMAWVATASSEGEPNVTPKGTVRILDDEHILFADLFSLKTRHNLEHNPRVAVTVMDLASYKGYQIKGWAELLTSGQLFEETAKRLAASQIPMPPVHYVVRIAVDAVFDQSAGPDAGKQIA